MGRFKTYRLAMSITAAALLLHSPPAFCENSPSASINIRQVADGLVVIVNSSQKSLDSVHFDCAQENNEIVVDLPTDNALPILESLQKNPHVRPGGVSLAALAHEDLKRITITPRLKLYCSGVKLVSKFQRYVTYFFPAGRNLKLTAAGIKGFEFDENAPRPQVSGSLLLKLAEPLGTIDLADAVTTADNTLTLTLNPKDFVDQELLATAFSTKNLSVKTDSTASAGLHSFSFQTINDAVISKIKAKLVKPPSGDELRVDLTLSLSLYDTGKKYYQSGDSVRARLYMEAARNDPATALVARMSLGTIFWNDDHYPEAAKSFRELIELDRSWEFPEARYFAAKAYFLTNSKLSFELSAMLKEYLRRCDRTAFATCSDARELSDQANEPALKLTLASKPELKKLVARLGDPKLNFNEVQKNVFHYWATWCPLCLEEMPKIMKYAVAHPNVSLYIVAKNDVQKNIFNTLIKAGAIRRKNIYYYIDTKDDIMLRQMVPLVLANKEPVTPLPISVFLQREVPFYLTDRLNWTETELTRIWGLKYQE